MPPLGKNFEEINKIDLIGLALHRFHSGNNERECFGAAIRYFVCQLRVRRLGVHHAQVYVQLFLYRVGAKLGPLLLRRQVTKTPTVTERKTTSRPSADAQP